MLDLERTTRSLRATALVVVCAAIPATARADDFIRGDANGDGQVTLADAAMANAHLFWGVDLPCIDAADVDDSGFFSIEDQILLELFLLGRGEPPAAPYPEPGPDPTPSGSSSSGCEVPALPPLEDPASLIRVHDTIAPGGDDVHATIVVSVAHSLPIWSLFGAVEIGSDLVEDAEALGKDGALDVFVEGDGLRSSAFQRAQVKDGRMQFGLRAHGPTGLPPTEEIDVLAIKVCLRGGVPAGEYPLALVLGDFARGLTDDEVSSGGHPDAGRVITAALESATLTVLEDVVEYSTCRVRPLDGVNVQFRLGDATGSLGGTVAVPMFVNGDREGHGFGFEVRFDTEILEALRIEQVFTRPDDLPFVDEFSEVDNEAGAVRAFFKSSSHSERHFLPPYQDNPVVVLYFRVAGIAESTELEFNREYRLTTYKAFDDNYSPETANSFVLVNANIEIVPDISLFNRGDTNGDTLVNIADVSATLNFLFRDGDAPYCLDAADANDDGVLDVSDPIFTLDFLFRGVRQSLPPPNDGPGVDPTDDELECAR